MILARWFYRAVCSVWLLIAWAVGSTVRRFGRNARELEADHRRDGVGLLFLGLAIVFAASIWARMDNLAGQGIYTLTSAVVGEGSFAIPVLFALVGWRFFRHPDRNSALPPAEIGWTALLVGGLGLFSITRGVPTLAHARRRLARGQDRGRVHRHGGLVAARDGADALGRDAAARPGGLLRAARHHRDAGPARAVPAGRAGGAVRLPAPVR